MRPQASPPNQPAFSTHQHTLRQHRLDAADGLSCALFVFDEAESHMAVAVVAEAYAGDDGYLGFGQQQLRKLKRAEVLVGSGILAQTNIVALGDGTASRRG